MEEEAARFTVPPMSPDSDGDNGHISVTDNNEEDLVFNPPIEPSAKQTKQSGKQRAKKAASKKSSFVWEDGLVHFFYYQ